MRPLATMLMLRCTAALVPRALPRVSTRLLSPQPDGVPGCVDGEVWESSDPGPDREDACSPGEGGLRVPEGRGDHGRAAGRDPLPANGDEVRPIGVHIVSISHFLDIGARRERLFRARQ